MVSVLSEEKPLSLSSYVSKGGDGPQYSVLLWCPSYALGITTLVAGSAVLSRWHLVFCDGMAFGLGLHPGV